MAMKRPDRFQPAVQLSVVLDALSDPTRRQILLQLAEKDFCCGSFGALGPKTRLTYHFNRLRQAGLIESKRVGRFQILTLKRHEVENAYPGLLKCILRATKDEAS
jgi:DNA-binding transcriptional ArsR family regulator